MRKCKTCGEEKELELFKKQNIWRTHTCKLCHAKKYRSGKPNTGRFKKGHNPWNKGMDGVPKRTEPRYKKIGRKLHSEDRQGYKACDWVVKVMDRDGHKCQTCGALENLIAHHIIPWDDDASKRFDIENGQTLCRSCHSRHHRLEETKNRN